MASPLASKSANVAPHRRTAPLGERPTLRQYRAPAAVLRCASPRFSCHQRLLRYRLELSFGLACAPTVVVLRSACLPEFAGLSTRDCQKAIAMTDTSRYPAYIFWSVEDEGFIALAPDLPGCAAFGGTQTEALRELQDAITAWRKTAVKAGRPIPPPSTPAAAELASGPIIVKPPRP